MEKRDMTYRPRPDYRYWLHDPEGDGMTYYRTKEDRDKAGAEAVAGYLEDGWAEEVEYVAAGEVTHSAQCLDKKQRPDDLDEEGCDGDGTYWGDFTWIGNYALEPLVPNVQAQGRCADLSRSVPWSAVLGMARRLDDASKVGAGETATGRG